MRQKRSALSLKSDSATEDFLDLQYNTNNDEESSIFMADATSSGNTSDLEKDYTNYIPEDIEEAEEVTEGTSLLGPYRGRSVYGGVNMLKEEGKEELGSQSVPNVIYASPARPHLPSPSTSNPLIPGIAFVMSVNDSYSGVVFAVQLADASNGGL
jgi:hypothetical protein